MYAMSLPTAVYFLIQVKCLNIFFSRLVILKLCLFVQFLPSIPLALFKICFDVVCIFLPVYRAKWTYNISNLPDDAIASFFWGQSLSSRILTWSIRFSRSVVVFGPQTAHRPVCVRRFLSSIQYPFAISNASELK